MSIFETLNEDLHMKDGTHIKKGQIFKIVENPNSSKHVIFVYNDKAYSVLKKYFEEKKVSKNYCRYCHSHNVNAVYSGSKKEGGLNLSIHCNDCGQTYGTYRLSSGEML
jgi:superfamily II helicase